MTPPADPHIVPYVHDDLHNMPTDKEKSRIEIILDNSALYLRGVGVDVEPARLAGHLALYLTEPTALKEITLNFRGKARLPSPASDSVSINNNPLSYVVCNHDWSFLEGEKTHSHTLKAGRHIFPFQLRIGGSLPSTIDPRAHAAPSILYKLRAQAVKAGFGFHNNIHAAVQVPIIRSFAPEAIEYQQSLEIENSWPEKLMYSIMIPHKAWAAGDQVTALVKFTTIAKGVAVLNIQTLIYEQTKVTTRSGVHDASRTIASIKHNIVNGRIVEAPTARVGQSSPSRSHTRPPTPTSSSSPSSPSAHRPTHSHPAPSFYPLTPIHPTAGPSTDSLDSEPESESSDLVAYLNIHIPHFATPSHTLDPIQVAHRIRWHILIANPDGHTSELRCSLPLYLLDHRLLSESRAYSGPTRRLLLGLDEPSTEGEEVFLPSYSAHVRDRVANMYLPESAVVRVANPWISHGASPTFGPGNKPSAMILPICPPSNSGSSTPLYPYPSTLFGQGLNHLLAHLPHQPREDTTAPLEWINSELLISLSGGAPLRPPRPVTAQAKAEEEDLELITPPASRRHSHSSSGPASGLMSRLRSRSGSVERDERRPVATPLSSSSSNSSHNEGSNTGHGIRTMFKHWLPSRSSHFHSHPHPTHNNIHPSPLSSPVPADSDDGYQHSAATSPMASTFESTDVLRTGAELLHRAFTETPDYAVAARGFIGGVPPLSSMAGLPSYEEAAGART